MSKKQLAPKETRNWYRDRYQSVLLQRRILIFISMLSLAATLLSVLVIAKMTPLKSVEPFVIQVDAKSGITQTVDPLTIRDISGLESVNNYFIVQYIRAREGYSVSDVSRNLNIVRLMSESSSVYPKFKKEASPSNPNSVAARMGSSGTRIVKIRSISYIKPNIAQARLLIEETAANRGTVQLNMIATVTFEYVKLQLNNEERYINPLGFMVNDYRIDEETVSK